MKTTAVRECFICLLTAFALSNNARADIALEFRGFIDSSAATYPPATTAYAADGDTVVYRVVLPDSLTPPEPFDGLFQQTPLSGSIEIRGQTYDISSSIYTGFQNYVNPAIGTYNGACFQDVFGGDLAYGQFALYNLVGAQTTDAIGVLQPGGLIPAPGADPTSGYNIGILHFSDSETPQSHTYWRATEYSVVWLPHPEPAPDPDPLPELEPEPGAAHTSRAAKVKVDPNEGKTLALATTQGHLTVKECAQQLHISQVAARRSLQKLASKGILERRGKGSRMAYWLAGSQ